MHRYVDEWDQLCDRYSCCTAQLSLCYHGGVRQYCHGKLGNLTPVGAPFSPSTIYLLTIWSRLFSFVLTDGGTADLFWGFIVVGFGQTLVYASLAEAASM